MPDEPRITPLEILLDQIDLLSEVPPFKLEESGTIPTGTFPSLIRLTKRTGRVRRSNATKELNHSRSKIGKQQRAPKIGVNRSPLGRRLWACLRLAVMSAVLYAASLAYVTGSDSKSDKETRPQKKKEKATKKLTGAELYAIHCNRCHQERYATERTAAQWKTVVTHMRVRANLPAEQARSILKYLQEDSGK